MTKLLGILLFLVAVPAVSQERKPFVGKVVFGNDPVADLFIINKATGAEVKTNNEGNFTITAKVGDAIVVYSPQTNAREFAVTPASFIENPYMISVERKAVELDEVVVTQPKVSSHSLGLVPKNYMFETVGQRHLHRFTMQNSGPVAQLINAITGQTYYIELAKKYAQKEILLEKTDYLFTDEQLKTDYQIPEEYIKGFAYYIVDDAKYAEAVKLKNYGEAKVLAMGLAMKYREILKDE